MDIPGKALNIIIIMWNELVAVVKMTKQHFFDKKTAEKFVNSEKSITFASAIERDALQRRRNSCASREQKSLLLCRGAAKNADWLPKEDKRK